MSISISSGADAQAASAALSVTADTIRDSLGAQLITKTLDKLNASTTDTASAMQQSYQLQKEVLGAAGIGNYLDISA
ncbi:MAG: hypothetical protein LBM64_02030 [Deltaproteobacteria bacterium]|nr:hypothetical protein [Deltaproteobacteria bacterium]